MFLTDKKCVPCEGGVAPLKGQELRDYASQIDSAWRLLGQDKIQRNLDFTDFKEAMGFINDVANLAESEGHHPDIHIFYNKVTLELWTHAIRGLSENDFILAAKIDVLYTSNASLKRTA